MSALLNLCFDEIFKQILKRLIIRFIEMVAYSSSRIAANPSARLEDVAATDEQNLIVSGDIASSCYSLLQYNDTEILITLLLGVPLYSI